MEVTILFAPLVGAVLCGFGWRLIGEAAATWLATGLLFLAAVLSWIVFLGFGGETEQIHLFRWIESGTLAADWAIRLDRLTAIMLVVVTTVSSLVHLYSFGYMAHDPQWESGESYRPRFFAYLSFFTFAMLALVTADNLVQMFFGWEGVGLASYLLIGFYYRKHVANAAAIKAFIVNRVGDFGFALGIFAIYLLVDSIDFSDIFAAAPEIAGMRITAFGGSFNAANLVAVLLFIGAMGKSAQLFLHTWLPDAMEGPTPVSALIHAATMVTAGVFLVCRMSPLFEYAPGALTLVTVIGASTAFFAATVALVQNDIKRVIAYSTCSQLGYMFVAAGVGMYSAAMFHLFTHAFFKALLFLGAGSVIQAMHHEQDMRNYGGLRGRLPWTFGAMLVGTLAITGVGIPLTSYGLAGFLSKDAIVESAWAGATTYGFWLLVSAAAMTAFYSWRLVFLTFFGEGRGDGHSHAHVCESPLTMLVPLGALSLGAIFSGWLLHNQFFGETEDVGRFYGIETMPESGDGHDAAGSDVDHRDDTHGEDGAAHGDADHSGGTHHVFVGKPGEGAIHFAPGNSVLTDAHSVRTWVRLSPFVAMLLGFGLAYWFYIVNPALPGRLAQSQRHLYRFLLNKWYFDELYDAVLVRPAVALGRFLWRRGDGFVIDGLVNGISMTLVPRVTRLAARMQSGYIFTYALWMVLGIVALVTWVSVGGGLE